ncbi:NAD(P)/FAD-dependent oxidoreductase [Arthrobacter sp. B3I4]|uniref:NAD(P)/FAD-dependent oxidoreductase n=1 Tax=Arthrobacter sp. B3I4 TaxID=3042267 RepID=UPI0027825311|nr:NAD(P)/FAD-dependent oxidoreductase [Arthrobacter sp. B3I4]MDQ0756209.1 thioredoxin reductase [Arthrobacter sp. B3I4]
MQQTTYDVVIVGGGAAGLSAAVALCRSLRSVLVVDAGAPRNGRSAGVHGFLSREGTAPADLLAAGREEVLAYGGEITTGKAVSASGGPDGFTVLLEDGRTIASRRLLIASGFEDELPEVPGVEERWGRDVMHCPYCHGWEIRHQAIGVLATEPTAVQEALLLRQWSDNVTLFQHTLPAPTAEELEQLDARSVEVVEGEVKSLQILKDALAGIVLHSGDFVPCEALHVSPRAKTRSPLIRSLGLQDEAAGSATAQYLKTDADGQTAVSGVWAAGNVTDPTAQVATAAAAGVKAASAINADLVAEDVRRAVAAARQQAPS